MYSKYEISYLFKERGKGVKLNERLLFNHFFNSVLVLLLPFILWWKHRHKETDRKGNSKM